MTTEQKKHSLIYLRFGGNNVHFTVAEEIRNLLDNKILCNKIKEQRGVKGMAIDW